MIIVGMRVVPACPPQDSERETKDIIYSAILWRLIGPWWNFYFIPAAVADKSVTWSIFFTVTVCSFYKT